jgi:hypothetical protein
MLMLDDPFAVYFTEANGRPPPHIDRLSVSIRSVDSIEAVAEGYVIARGDAQVPNLVADWTLERRQPSFCAPSKSVRADILQWVDQVEQEDIGREVGHESNAVLDAVPLPS